MGIVTRQILYNMANTHEDVIYCCGPNTGFLTVASKHLFLWSDNDQVIVEMDCLYPTSISTNNGRLLGTGGSSRSFTVATVSTSFYWLFSDISWNTYSTGSVISANVKYKLKFVFDVANHQILLTRTVLSSETVTNYSKSISSTALNNLGTSYFTFGGNGSEYNAVNTYIWKNSLLIQKVKNGVTTTVFDGERAVENLDYYNDGATIVTE